jgi:hypothetical protein
VIGGWGRTVSRIAQMVLVLMLLMLCRERMQRRRAAHMTKTPPQRRMPMTSFLFSFFVSARDGDFRLGMMCVPAQC